MARKPKRTVSSFRRTSTICSTPRNCFPTLTSSSPLQFSAKILGLSTGSSAQFTGPFRQQTCRHHIGPCRFAAAVDGKFIETRAMRFGRLWDTTGRRFVPRQPALWPADRKRYRGSCKNGKCGRRPEMPSCRRQNGPADKE